MTEPSVPKILFNKLLVCVAKPVVLPSPDRNETTSADFSVSALFSLVLSTVSLPVISWVIPN
ncbi:hypothetical protein D3C87_2128880 [compost metagenome]